MVEEMTTPRYQYIVFPAQGKAGLSPEEEMSPLWPDQVRMRTSISLISPGTELAFFAGTHSSLKNVSPDEARCAPGYSGVGIIEEVGSNVKTFKKGERIFAETGHVTRSDIAADAVVPIPAGVSDEQAVFTMLASIALHGLREAAPQFGENVLVLGLGAIGQAAVRLLRLTAVRQIIAADVFPMRLGAARQGGADVTLSADGDSFSDEIRRLSDGRGCEIVIDATGNAKAANTALSSAANRGRVILLGSPHGEVTLDLYKYIHKQEISLIGAYNPNCPLTETSRSPWTQKRNRALILEYFRQKRLDLLPLITHRGPYQNPQPLYDALWKEKNNALAGVLDWTH